MKCSKTFVEDAWRIPPEFLWSIDHQHFRNGHEPQVSRYIPDCQLDRTTIVEFVCNNFLPGTASCTVNELSGIVHPCSRSPSKAQKEISVVMEKQGDPMLLTFSTYEKYNSLWHAS